MLRLLSLLALCLSLALIVPAAQAASSKDPAYLALGDSLAFGVGAADPARGGYVGLTYDALRKSDRYRERGLDLVNLAVPGATSADLLLPGGQLDLAVAEIADRAEDSSSADDNVEVISVNIGGNDILSLAAAGSPCLTDPLSSECQGLAAETLGALEDNLRDVLGRLRKAAPAAQIVLVDLYSPFSGRGGPVELVSDFAIYEVNAVTERVSSDTKLGVRLASVYPVFYGRASRLVAADNVHPNDMGHAVIAEVVLATIQGREPDLPESLPGPTAVEGTLKPPLGEGGLLPVERGGDGTSVPLLLAVLLPVALLGFAVVVGVYRSASGR